MKKLIKTKKEVVLINTDEQVLLNKNDVKIKVKIVGLCRTDLLVAQGLIEVNNDIVLGHEFSGEVVESKSKKFKIGDKVAVNPFIKEFGFLGLDIDGCLQEFIVLNERQIVKFNNINFKTAAYLEPVAASMAVLKAKISKSMLGAVFGKNRIAELTYLILISNGYKVELIDDLKKENHYDYIVETVFEEDVLKKIIKALKPNGKLIIKSRKKNLVGLIASDLVSKELNMVAVNYYDFKKSMRWLETNNNLIEHLLGESFFVDDWEKAFEKAKDSENKKIFINF